MHISTPPQILPADGFPQGDSPAEGLAYDSPFLGKAQYKNGHGIFARLLEALTGNDKPLSKEALDEAEAGADAEKAGESSFAWQVSANASQAAETHEPVHTHDSVPESPAAVTIFNSKEEIPASLFSQELLGGQDQSKPIQAAVRDSGHTAPDKNSAPEFLAGKHAGETLDFDVLSNRFENREMANSAGEGKGREKPSGAIEGENLFTRHTEAEFSPSQAAMAGSEGGNPFLSKARGRERPAIEVRDLRTPEVRETAGFNPEGYKGAHFNAAYSEIGINVELKPSPQLGDGWNTRGNGREFSQGRLFEDALARELRGNLSADIVKNASLIIRNGGEGTIRLALNPASLGHVKVHLEMTENKIMGHIIVESSEAFRAFQRELPALERAFRDSGFIETSLDMSLAQDQDGGEFGEEQQQWPEGNFPALDPALASRYDAGREVTELAEEASASGTQLLSASERKTVNLFI